MITIEDAVLYVKGAAETAGRKTGEWVEIAKIKLQIADLRREIAAANEGLGRLVYDARQSGEDIEEMVEACVAHIRELYEQMDKLEAKVMEAKNVVRCDECGAFNESVATFCNRCGTKLS